MCLWFVTHTHTDTLDCLVSPSIFINLWFVNLRLADRTDRKQTVKLYIWCIYVYIVVHVKIIKRLWAWGGVAFMANLRIKFK